MQSFFFWLTLAVAFGALLGSSQHPGFPEIIISLAVVNGLFYCTRGLAKKRRQRVTA
jgi:hypothetical protein